ncbi:MAG TPA: lysophospholipid acyltransferase family protein [Candidatus Methylacidiphilales bacterium]|nr:lysophospholipid acyltransferase family protein [Candidatus Methylacidiphilales bacterium]
MVRHRTGVATATQLMCNAMRPWYRLCYKFIEAIKLGYYQTRVEGYENVPAGGCLVVSNHASFLDPTTVGWALQRECFFLARKTLFKPPVMSRLLPICNVVPIDQDNADLPSMRRVIRLMKDDGYPVILFPEGTRTEDGELKKALPGAAFLACKAGVPILPVRLFGSFEAWPRQRKLPGYHPMRVVIGRPFMPAKARSKQDYEVLADRMMKEIGALK